jgi:hypothetical protein
MDFKDAVRKSMELADFMVEKYVTDLTPEEMLTRPVPEANHVAWQLGHLIAAERMLVEGGVPGSMPPLPAGFAERHNKDTAKSDKPGDFLTKDEYLKLAKEIRAATLKVLDSAPNTDFDKPVTGKVPPFVQSIGDCFVTVGSHWTMHAGQWVALRRKLHREVMF